VERSFRGRDGTILRSFQARHGIGERCSTDTTIRSTELTGQELPNGPVPAFVVEVCRATSAVATEKVRKFMGRPNSCKRCKRTQVALLNC
jgi:hypothetical protein